MCEALDWFDLCVVSDDYINNYHQFLSKIQLLNMSASQDLQ